MAVLTVEAEVALRVVVMVHVTVELMAVEKG